MPQKALTEEELEACYAKIKSHKKEQRENYAKFLELVGKEQLSKWKQLADELHVELDVDTGRIRYKSSFKPMDLQVEICYIRHGKTEGNTEPRVFQGMVDYPENQLNAIGKEQAALAAERMEIFVKEGKWGVPDLIVSSPLQRAVMTAQPYRENHGDVPYYVMPEIAEMKFGSWDNQKVADIPPDNFAHLFYLEQNALVKSTQPHQVDTDAWVHPEWLNGETAIEGENFLECMRRQREALIKVESAAKEIMRSKHPNETRKLRAVVYGHSMAGAAVSVLLGFGKEDPSGWLGFDGSYIMPNATPTLLISEHKKKQE